MDGLNEGEDMKADYSIVVLEYPQFLTLETGRMPDSIGQDASSDLYVNADREMFACLRVIDPRSAATDYESVLEHYGVGSCTALTEKIRNIQSFKSIKAPWKQADGGRWTPDFTSRYFTEDIPFGTKVIQDYARKAGIETPTIDYLVGNCLAPER